MTIPDLQLSIRREYTSVYTVGDSIMLGGDFLTRFDYETRECIAICVTNADPQEP